MFLFRLTLVYVHVRIQKYLFIHFFSQSIKIPPRVQINAALIFCHCLFLNCGLLVHNYLVWVDCILDSLNLPHQNPFKVLVYYVMILSALEGGNHTD